MKFSVSIYFLFVCVFFARCGKDTPASLQEAPYAMFSSDTALVDADSTGVEIRINWSKTKWKLSVEGDGFITGFSKEAGGDLQYAGSITKVRVGLEANLNGESRKQQIVLQDLATGKEQRMLLVQSAGSGNGLFTIRPDTRYQKVAGFGGMYNPAVWLGSNLISSADLDQMYDPTKLGYNILRLMIYPDEKDWVKDVAGAKKAQDYGAIIFACPWDCTDGLADTVVIGAKSFKHLKKSNYQQYTDHLIRYVNYMKANGVNLYAISIQNEPDMEFTHWAPQEVVDYIKGYGAQIRATGVKLMAPEACGTSPEYTDPVLQDAQAFGYVDIIAGHLYQGFIDLSDSYAEARHKYIAGLYDGFLKVAGKSWWMTEHLFNDGESDTDPAKWLFQKWSYNLNHLALEIDKCMEADCSAYVYWYLKRFYGMMGDNDSRSPVSSGLITKNGYILAHYAKFAAGRTRIAVTSDNVSGSDILATAYAGDNDITVVLINLSENGRTLDFAVNAGSISAAAGIQTTETADMNAIECPINKDKKSVEIVSAAMSITSIKLTL